MYVVRSSVLPVTLLETQTGDGKYWLFFFIVYALWYLRWSIETKDWMEVYTDDDIHMLSH